jgi:hypothetical protein
MTEVPVPAPVPTGIETLEEAHAGLRHTLDNPPAAD